MLTLVTSNPAKYRPFAAKLERLRVNLEQPLAALPEIQTLSFPEALASKARAAEQMFGRPVLVDDAGLVLEAYDLFPGPLTATVLRSLGVPGLRRLVEGTSQRAAMECHLGCFVKEGLRSWLGRVEGRLDFSRVPADTHMILSDLFVPDEPELPGPLVHRARALAEFEQQAFDLHLDLNNRSDPEERRCADRPVRNCPFCAEFENDGLSIFAEMMGSRLGSRVVYEDEHFVVMPPLGSFIEGGLLLLTRQHILSMAFLPPGLFAHLEKLLDAIAEVVIERWGVPPLIFEHGPAPQQGKGVCCVDHAHFNIFPARVPVHPHLASRMNAGIGSVVELSRLRSAEFGYLFVQEADRSRCVYDGYEAPTQLVRRIIATELGFPDRWHWRDYPGCDELVATFQALAGKIHP